MAVSLGPAVDGMPCGYPQAVGRYRSRSGPAGECTQITTLFRARCGWA
jgi:hypothetical protein